MAANTWVGGASRTAQVDHITFALTWAASDTAATVIADEGGTAVTVSTVVSSGTLETVRDEHLADLQAATSAVFAALTFTSSGTTIIVATANVAGVPFHLTTAETTAGNGTQTESSSTASSGPEDVGVAANWDSGVMVSTDEVTVPGRTKWRLRYSLDQSAVDLNSLVIEEGAPEVGQPDQQWCLKLDVANSAGTVIKETGVALDGTHTAVVVHKCIGNGVYLDGTITNLDVNGPGVTGTVKVKNAAALTTLDVHGITGTVDVGTSVTALANVTSSGSRTNLILRSGNAGLDLDCAGGTCIYHEDATEGFDNIINRGAIINYFGSGAVVTLLDHRGGRTNLKPANEFAIAATTIRSGVVLGGNSATFTAAPVVRGGRVEQDELVTYTLAPPA